MKYLVGRGLCKQKADIKHPSEHPPPLSVEKVCIEKIPKVIHLMSQKNHS
jgi:hypothetical protein